MSFPQVQEVDWTWRSHCAPPGYCSPGVRWSSPLCRFHQQFRSYASSSTARRGGQQARGSSSFSATATHYEVLGVSQSATAKEIKQAYLQLCKVYHPDVAASSVDPDGSVFRRVQAAYETLSSPAKRAVYDANGCREFSTGSGDGGHNPFQTRAEA